MNTTPMRIAGGANPPAADALDAFGRPGSVAGWQAYAVDDCRLWVTQVGLACCAVETAAAAVSGLLAESIPSSTGADPSSADPMPEPGPGLDIAVLAGTLTDKAAPAVVASIARLTDRVGGRPLVISFGSCANSGGPYWDSYSVTKGVDQLIDVDLYVPGCPPRPQALAAAVVQLRKRYADARPV